jgi:hypothetical protein
VYTHNAHEISLQKPVQIDNMRNEAESNIVPVTREYTIPSLYVTTLIDLARQWPAREWPTCEWPRIEWPMQKWPP